MSDEDFERTERIVAEFGRPGGVGEMLQRKLQERAEAKESWVCVSHDATVRSSVRVSVSLYCVLVVVVVAAVMLYILDKIVKLFQLSMVFEEVAAENIIICGFMKEKNCLIYI